MLCRVLWAVSCAVCIFASVHVCAAAAAYYYRALSQQIGSPSTPLLEFLEEWTTESLEDISCSIIPESTKVC